MSKAPPLRALLWERIHSLECLHNFNRADGSHQIRGKDELTFQSYWAWRALLDLAERSRTQEPARPAWWTPHDPFLPVGRSRVKP